jgi:hypothetical protein
LLEAQAAESLLKDVLAAPSRAHAVAEVNDRLFDADRELRTGASIPRSMARIALGTGALIGLVQLARTLGGPESMLLSALLAFGAGLASALICWNFGRLADLRAQTRRDAWNHLARALLRLAAAGDGDAVVPPGPGGPGSGAKREP